MHNRVLFIGSKESGFRVLKNIFRMSPDKMIGCVTVDDSEDMRSKLKEFQSFCGKKNINIEVLTGKCDLTDIVEKFNPDICFVMGWYYIIPESLLEKVSGGFIGIHNSILPAHRGFAPVVWAMIGGENRTGFSVFSFDGGMDTGDVWYQEIVEIEADDYIADILDKIDKRIGLFFEKHYLKILSGELEPHKQATEGISYGARRTEEDGYIAWSKDNDKIYNFIKAQSKPYPGAFTTYRGKKITIWRAEKFQYPIQGNPGQVGLIDKENKEVIVVCGNNTGIIIRTIEVEGKGMVVTDYIKSLNYRLGS